MSDKKVLTIIPAKLGSTRLPEKNIRPLNGKPLIVRTIEAAIASNVCGRIVVSTESEIVADITREAGAEVPFLRPEHLAKDPYEVNHVCQHVLRELASEGCDYDAFVTLLPTSPFMQPEDIIECMKIFESAGGETVMSVSAFEHNPFGSMRFKNGGKFVLEPLFPDSYEKWSELPKAYRANGAVCICDAPRFIETANYYTEPIHGYEMAPERGVDIDTELDFRFAEFILQSREEEWAG